MRKFVYFPDLNEERVFIRVNPAWIYMLSIAPFIQIGEEFIGPSSACLLRFAQTFEFSNSITH